MGLPLPLAVRSLSESGYGGRVAALWGINGVASVVGSSLAMIVGITLGFLWAVSLGALIYLAVSVFSYLLRTSKEESKW